ncbi:uncharacterized [Tachysurus ichikawai]
MRDQDLLVHPIQSSSTSYHGLTGGQSDITLQPGISTPISRLSTQQEQRGSERKVVRRAVCMTASRLLTAE